MITGEGLLRALPLLMRPTLTIACILLATALVACDGGATPSGEDPPDDFVPPAYDVVEYGELEICIDAHASDERWAFPEPLPAMVAEVGPSQPSPCDEERLVVHGEPGPDFEVALGVEGWDPGRLPRSDLRVGESVRYVPVTWGSYGEDLLSFAVERDGELVLAALHGRAPRQVNPFLQPWGLSVALGPATGTGEVTSCGHRLHAAVTVATDSESVTLRPGASAQLDDVGVTATLVTAYRTVGCDRPIHVPFDAFELVLARTAGE